MLVYIINTICSNNINDIKLSVQLSDFNVVIIILDNSTYLVDKRDIDRFLDSCVHYSIVRGTDSYLKVLNCVLQLKPKKVIIIESPYPLYDDHIKKRLKDIDNITDLNVIFFDNTLSYYSKSIKNIGKHYTKSVDCFTMSRSYKDLDKINSILKKDSIDHKDKDIMDKIITKYVDLHTFYNHLNKMRREFNIRIVADKKKDVVTYLSKIYSESDPQISKRLKKVIENRAYKNSDIIKMIADDFRFYSEDDYDSFISRNRTDKMIISEQTLISSTTMSTWYDEIENHGCLGVLANCRTGYLGKVGNADFLTFDPLWETYSAEDYLFSVKDYLEKNTNRDINEAIIVTDGLKNPANALFLLYINKMHWRSAKKFLPCVTGTFMSHNPLSFTEGHIKSYFIALVRYASQCRSIYQYQVFFCLWRTCYEIAKERGYDKGFSVMLNKIESFRYSSQYEIVLGQTLLFNNIDNTDLNNFYGLCIKEIAKKIYLKKNKKEDKNLSDQIKSSRHYKILVKNIEMRDKIFSIYKDSDFSDTIDEYFGVLDDNTVKNIVSVNSDRSDIYDDLLDKNMFV